MSYNAIYMINSKFLSVMLLHPQKALKPLCTEIDPLYIVYITCSLFEVAVLCTYCMQSINGIHSFESFRSQRINCPKYSRRINDVKRIKSFCFLASFQLLPGICMRFCTFLVSTNHCTVSVSWGNIESENKDGTSIKFHSPVISSLGFIQLTTLHVL